MKCAECQRLNMRAETDIKRPMARAAFGVCNAGSPWNYVSIFWNRDCEVFLPEEDSKVETIFKFYKKERTSENINA